MVNGFCIAQKRDACSIEYVSKEDVTTGIMNEYLEECQIDVEGILHIINIEKCNLLRVKSNIYDLLIEKLYEVMN